MSLRPVAQCSRAQKRTKKHIGLVCLSRPLQGADTHAQVGERKSIFKGFDLLSDFVWVLIPSIYSFVRLQGRVCLNPYSSYFNGYNHFDRFLLFYFLVNVYF